MLIMPSGSSPQLHVQQRRIARSILHIQGWTPPYQAPLHQTYQDSPYRKLGCPTKILPATAAAKVGIEDSTIRILGRLAQLFWHTSDHLQSSWLMRRGPWQSCRQAGTCSRTKIISTSCMYVMHVWMSYTYSIEKKKKIIIEEGIEFVGGGGGGGG